MVINDGGMQSAVPLDSGLAFSGSVCQQTSRLAGAGTSIHCISLQTNNVYTSEMSLELTVTACRGAVSTKIHALLLAMDKRRTPVKGGAILKKPLLAPGSPSRRRMPLGPVRHPSEGDAASDG